MSTKTFKTIDTTNRRRSRKSRRNGNLTQQPRVLGIAQRALRIATSLSNVINSEAKYLDPNENSVSLTSAAVITCLTGVARGTGPSDRNGDSILLNHLFIKYLIKWNTSNTDSPSYCRLLIIRDLNDESDTAPTIAQLLTYSTAPGASCSPLNMLFADRFQLLFDKTHYLDTYHAGETGEVSLPFKPNPQNPIRNPWHATFNGTNGTDTSKGHLYLIKIGSGTTNMNTLTYAGRLLYYDN